MRFVLCLFAALVLAAACSRPPDEMRIRSAIEAMQTAAEARDAGGVLDHLAGDFTGNNADVDREGLAQLLRIQFLRSDAIGVAIGPIDVAIDGDRAVAKFDMTVSDRSRRWLASGSETYAVVSGWRREGGGWVCYNASWSNGAQ